MNEFHMASYIGTHRKRAGLSQRDLGILLGYLKEGAVSRHERHCATPPFQIALGYEAIFRIPVSALFPYAFEKVQSGVAARIDSMERELQESTARGRGAARIARKLEWMNARRNPEIDDVAHGRKSA